MNPYNNVPVKKIGLKQWYEDHPSKEAQEGLRYARLHDPTFYSKSQADHIMKKINLYEPIEAYREKWYHNNKTGKYNPIPNTKQRDDLPPIYLQWKEDYKRRFRNGKT